MSGKLQVMVPAPSWGERAEVARYRAQVRARLEREEQQRRAAARLAGPVAAARRPEPAAADYAPCPPSPWGPVKLPSPWRPDRPAALSPGDFAPLPASPWDELRRVEQGSRPAPEPDPVRRRRVADDDSPYAKAPRNPWGA
jgi:hypothetical protein